MYETIVYEVQEGAAKITLNRPEKLNAFVAKMNSEIQQAVRKASKDENVRCIVLTGEGRAFCSGQDLAEVDEAMDHGQVLRDCYGPMVMEIEQCEKPVVAAVNGVAAGAGFSLALACDFRLMAEDASFINAFIHVGLIPDSGNIYKLSQLVGTARAAEISILGEKLNSSKALELGLATRVYSKEEWEEEVRKFTSILSAMPTKAISLIKRSLKDAEQLSFKEFLKSEAEYQRIAGLTEDHHEGIEAFAAKRKPQFSGR